jgi:hypothetical protein
VKSPTTILSSVGEEKEKYNPQNNTSFTESSLNDLLNSGNVSNANILQSEGEKINTDL